MVALRKKFTPTPHVDVQISRSAISFKIGQKRMFSSSMHGNASSVSPNRRADARAIIRFRDRSSLPQHFRLLEIYHKEEAKRRLNRIGGGSQKDLFALYVVVFLHDGYNIRDSRPENAPKGSASENCRGRKGRSWPERTPSEKHTNRKGRSRGDEKRISPQKDEYTLAFSIIHDE